MLSSDDPRRNDLKTAASHNPEERVKVEGEPKKETVAQNKTEQKEKKGKKIITRKCVCCILNKIFTC